MTHTSQDIEMKREGLESNEINTLLALAESTYQTHGNSWHPPYREHCRATIDKAAALLRGPASSPPSGEVCDTMRDALWKMSDAIGKAKVAGKWPDGTVFVGLSVEDREGLCGLAYRALSSTKRGSEWRSDDSLRELLNMPRDGRDLFESVADWQEEMVVGGIRLQNAVHNVLAERLYENGRKEEGVAVHFLMRLSMLAHEAGLPGYSKENPVVAEAIAALGDPAQPNIAKDPDAAREQARCCPREGEQRSEDEEPYLFGRLPQPPLPSTEET